MRDSRLPAEVEWMDRPAFGPREVRDTYRYLSPVNRLFGGVEPALAFFRAEWKRWSAGERISVLDVGCGAGDVSLALARWGRRTGCRLEIQALDRHGPTVELARERCAGYSEIRVRQGDIWDVTGEVYDYVHASQVAHHYDDQRAVAFFRWLARMSRRAALITDLLWAPAHYAATWLLTLFTSSVFRHDARLSVRRGFRADELRAMLQGAGLQGYCVRQHWFYRFSLVLSGQANENQ